MLAQVTRPAGSIASKWLRPFVPDLGSQRHIGSKSAAERRKEKSKQRFKYAKVPARAMQQQGGDFPVQLRPSPEVRDLQDSSLDSFAQEEERPPVKIKPHKVREAVQGLRANGPRAEDKASVQQLHDARKLASELPVFRPERDLKEEDAAELAAYKARKLAQRAYKWVPNPFSSKPGPLGSSPHAEAKYYERYFKGDRPSIDQGPVPANAPGDEEMKPVRQGRPPRQRVSPKRFWYQSDYTPPDVRNVPLMASRDLKYAMVNQAHQVRTWRNDHAEGRAAGLPPGNEELWMAFGYRAADLASPHAEESSGLPAKRHPCSLNTCLRVLQALASVQAGPYSALQRIVSRVMNELHDLRPQECYYLLQALARLRLRHPKTSLVLKRLSLTWRLLPEKHFLKAANAVAKLDIAGDVWARHLKLALSKVLPQLSGRRLAMIKAITVMELLNSPASLQLYLEQSAKLRGHFWYSRHLRMVELHVHLVYPDVWASLDEGIKSFLEEARNASVASEEVPSRPEQAHNPSANDAESDSEDLSDSEAGKSFDKKIFSSALHVDVSRVLRDGLGIEHQNRLLAGALSVDMCHLPTMTIVEAADQWQFYMRSAQTTALARRRHELLRAMGFRLVQVPHFKWSSFSEDREKMEYLRRSLPPALLVFSKSSQIGNG